MIVVQNLDTIFLPVTPDDYEVFLNKERFINGRMVNYLIPLFDNNNSTFNDVPLFQESFLNSTYINIHKANGKNDYIKRLNCALLSSNNMMYKKIDTIMDFDLTKICFSQNVANRCYLPIMAIYTNELYNIQVHATNQVKLKFTVSQPGTYYLKDFGGYTLKGKQIKEIESDKDFNAFLTIRTKDNKNNLNNVPVGILHYLYKTTKNKLYFDNILVDPDNSTIQFEQPGSIELTFKY